MRDKNRVLQITRCGCIIAWVQKRCYPPVQSEVLYEHSTAADSRSASGSAQAVMHRTCYSRSGSGSAQAVMHRTCYSCSASGSAQAVMHRTCYSCSASGYVQGRRNELHESEEDSNIMIYEMKDHTGGRMEYIKGFTFLLEGNIRGNAGKHVQKELLTMKDELGTDTVILAFQAVQQTAHSEEIDFTSRRTPEDGELCMLIAYAKEIGLRVVLKPMLNCLSGEWRAYINFISPDVVCEPKWRNWFENYGRYILHYADIAERTGCEMLVIGCELVMAQSQERLWRELIARIRERYSGLLTFNVDKYQEERLTWWDALDVISSSGYYPIDKWQENLDRIESVVQRYGKPFFFAECGCPCRKGASEIPNDWTREGALDAEEQAEYYKTMFSECSGRSWLDGFSGWAWTSHDIISGSHNDGYSVYGKPAADVILENYSDHSNSAAE